jgi:dihydroorotase (multifunctional complex type)
LIDLVIKNGRLLVGKTLVNGGIAVDNGKVVAVARDLNLPKAERIYDAKGFLILPGFIDLHVHFRDPGYPEREDFQTGTAAAAAGGVTCVGDMPNPIPSTTTIENYKEKQKIASSRAIVDYALYGGTGESNFKNIKYLNKHGAKIFKSYSTTKYKELKASTRTTIIKILNRTKATDSLLMYHAENQKIIDKATKCVKEIGLEGFTAHAHSRPPISEEKTIKKVLNAARKSESQIYICHVSTEEGIQTIRNAKKKGVKVIAETCPHYLLLTEKDGVKLGPYAKTNPPLRSIKHQTALWNGIFDGTIDVVSSDHCPYTKEEKNQGLEDIFRAPPGMPGLDTSISLMLTQVSNGRLSLNRLVELYSVNPAKTLDIYPKKGALHLNSDADVTIVDPNKEEKIRSDKLYTKNQLTMFEGKKIKGIPIATFVRGTLVMEDGVIIGKTGYGKTI